MRIGLGVTTCGRPAILKGFTDALESFNISPHRLFINDDTTTRHGVAKSKNNCLYNLRDCDLILLLDDDCYVKSKDALDFIIEGHERSAQGHFLFMDMNHHKFVKTWWPTDEVGIDLWDDCSGVFMSITKRTFEKVGYFDDRYLKYGYEHAGYSRRVHLAGCNSKPFMSLVGMDAHFKALDFETKIEGSMSPEAKAEYGKVGGHNDEIYHDELKNWHSPFRDFKPELSK